MHTSARISCGDEWGCVRLPTGFTLRFPTSIDEASLRAVLLALEPR
jgi:hypothetical protein